MRRRVHREFYGQGDFSGDFFGGSGGTPQWAGLFGNGYQHMVVFRGTVCGV